MAEFTKLDNYMLFTAFVFTVVSLIIMGANYTVEKFYDYEEPLTDFERQKWADSTNAIAHLQNDVEKLKDDVIKLKGYVCKVNYNDDLKIQPERAEERLEQCKGIGR